MSNICAQVFPISGSCDGQDCLNPVAGTIVLPGSPGGVSVPCSTCWGDGPDGAVIISVCVPTGLGVWEPGDPITMTIPLNPGPGSEVYTGKFDPRGNFCLRVTDIIG